MSAVDIYRCSLTLDVNMKLTLNSNQYTCFVLLSDILKIQIKKIGQYGNGNKRNRNLMDYWN